MSSMTSRRMGLGLILAGASTLSGCNIIDPNEFPPERTAEIQAYNQRQLLTFGLFAGTPFANTVPQAAVMNATAHMMNADNAVRTGDFQNNRQGATNTNQYVGENNNLRPVIRAEPFTCSYMADFDPKDGCIDPRREAVDRGKVVFYVGDKLTYAVSQENCRGKSLTLFGQRTPESELSEVMTCIIQKDYSTPQTLPLTLDTPGVFRSYWTLDGVKIGEHLIQVKPRPNQ